MLFKCKTRKAITALFIFLFIFQLIPNYYVNSDCLNDKANKSSLILPFRVYESKIVFLNIDNQKGSCDSVFTHINDNIINYITFFNKAEPDFIHYVKFYDYRKEIKKVTSHYFNGSKYKNITPII